MRPALPGQVRDLVAQHEVPQNVVHFLLHFAIVIRWQRLVRKAPGEVEAGAPLRIRAHQPELEPWTGRHDVEHVHVWQIEPQFQRIDVAARRRTAVAAFRLPVIGKGANLRMWDPIERIPCLNCGVLWHTHAHRPSPVASG